MHYGAVKIISHPRANSLWILREEIFSRADVRAKKGAERCREMCLRKKSHNFHGRSLVRSRGEINEPQRRSGHDLHWLIVSHNDAKRIYSLRHGLNVIIAGEHRKLTRHSLHDGYVKANLYNLHLIDLHESSSECILCKSAILERIFWFLSNYPQSKLRVLLNAKQI